VKDVKQFTLDGVPTADLYVPLAQMPASQAPALASRMYWVIRTDHEPAALIPEVRRTVRAVDPDVATSSVRSLDAVLALSLGGRRANVRLLEVFGQVSVLLAATGVYAVAAFSAGARRRELAIRSAFGASRRDLIRLVLLGELRPVLVGIGGGLACALIVARSLGDALFEISPMDATTYAWVAVALGTVAVAASCLPALRAGRVDPAEALRP
jgi:ABC-type antimicrobial peptide transport system permease subunit